MTRVTPIHELRVRKVLEKTEAIRMGHIVLPDGRHGIKSLDLERVHNRNAKAADLIFGSLSHIVAARGTVEVVPMALDNRFALQAYTAKFRKLPALTVLERYHLNTMLERASLQEVYMRKLLQPMTFFTDQAVAGAPIFDLARRLKEVAPGADLHLAAVWKADEDLGIEPDLFAHQDFLIEEPMAYYSDEECPHPHQLGAVSR